MCNNCHTFIKYLLNLGDRPSHPPVPNVVRDLDPDLQPEHQFVREHGGELHEQTSVPAPHVRESEDVSDIQLSKFV